MINNESQVRLSIELQGRLGAKTSNSTPKHVREKMFKALTKGKKVSNGGYAPPAYQEAIQIVTLSPECVSFFISEDSRPLRMPPSMWKKASKIARLETHLQITADDIAKCANAKFTYKIIN